MKARSVWFCASKTVSGRSPGASRGLHPQGRFYDIQHVHKRCHNAFTKRFPARADRNWLWMGLDLPRALCLLLSNTNHDAKAAEQNAKEMGLVDLYSGEYSYTGWLPRQDSNLDTEFLPS
jgi:hypothetical protein